MKSAAAWKRSWLALGPDNEQAAMALSWVLQQQQAVDDLHPTNAAESASIAQETVAEVLRGALRYPSEGGGWQSGDVDLSEHLDKYRDREVVLIAQGRRTARRGLGKVK